MTIMGGVFDVRSPCGLQAYGCLQYFEPQMLSQRRPWQSGHSSGNSRGTCGIAICRHSCEKSKPWSVNLDSDPYRRVRSRKGQSGFRKIDVLRGSTPSGSVPHNSQDNHTTSTTTTPDSTQHGQSAERQTSSEDSEQGAGLSSGLSALDAYFSKLKGDEKVSEIPVNASKLNSAFVIPLSKQRSPVAIRGANSPATVDKGEKLQGLNALDAYFEKLKPRKSEPEEVKDEVQPDPDPVSELTDEELFMKSLIEVKEDYEKYRSSVKDQGSSPTGDLKFQVTSNSEMEFPNWELPEEHGTNSNLINVLVAVNIAVYLFGLASPHEALGITDSSLPVVYGAKVNELMLAGQWWRFITPMFLHASVLHVGLGSWALLSFGPAVESAYGTLGFSMIYFLGGLFGDLTSFFHTTEWTVGGTGPIYALVGTWLVYLLKNREIIGKDIADDMIRKVVILSAVNVALCNSLPIDDWTHLGAVLFGTFFGVLASPTMQLNVTVKETSPQKEDGDGEAYLWFNDGASPARLTLIFVLCLGIFFTLYQLSISGSNDFDLLQDTDVFS